MKIKVLIGSPKAGKTTLSKKFEEAGYHVLHTDDYIDLDWTDAPGAILDEVKRLKDDDMDILIEGVSTARILDELDDLGASYFIRLICPENRRENKHTGMRTMVKNGWDRFRKGKGKGKSTSIMADMLTEKTLQTLIDS